MKTAAEDAAERLTECARLRLEELLPTMKALAEVYPMAESGLVKDISLLLAERMALREVLTSARQEIEILEARQAAGRRPVGWGGW